MNLFQLYLDAAALPNHQEQQHFIDTLAQKSAKLAEKLQALLADSNNTLHLADDIRHAANRLQQLDICGELTGLRLGYWQLERIIAHGGMSTVYLASRQDGQFEQQVAIKVLNPLIYPVTANSKAFAEANVAAKLNHPGITKVFDAGITEYQGQQAHYIVMEYIEGQNLDTWLSHNKPKLTCVVQLFIALCDALHYAHTHQIIHADLKPENILVDEHGKPKLIDFGIARLKQQDEQAPAYVQHYVKALSRHYASPEQLKGEPLTTLSDTYSLGILLRYALKTATVQTTLLADELNVLSIKATAALPEQRFLSVHDLKSELIALTEQRPLSVGPAVPLYRLKKFVRRNPVVTALFAFAFISVCTGIAGTSWGLLEATKQRDIANTARTLAEDKAQELEQVVRFQSAQLASINPLQLGENLNTIIHDAVTKLYPSNAIADLRYNELQSSLNYTDIGLSLLQNTIFDKTIIAIDEQFSEQPDIQTQLLHTTAVTLNELGLQNLANETFQKVIQIQQGYLGESNSKTLQSQVYLAEVLYHQRKINEAKTLLESTLPIQQKVVAANSEDLLQSLNIYSLVLMSLGNFTEAEQILEDGLAKSIAANSSYKENFYNNLATLYYQTGNTEKAINYLGLVREVYKSKFGEENPLYLTATINYAALNHRHGNIAYARNTFEQNQKLLEKVLGNQHINTLLNRANLAALLNEINVLDISIKLLEQNIQDGTPILGETHFSVLNWHESLASAYHRSGQFNLAQQHYEHTHKLMQQQRGAEHHVTLGTQIKLARLYDEQGKYAAAAELLNDAKQKLEATQQTKSRLYLEIYYSFGMLYRAMQDLQQSKHQFETLFSINQNILNDNHWQLGMYKIEYGITLQALNQPEEAKAQLIAGIEQLSRLVGEEHRMTLKGIQHLNMF